MLFVCGAPECFNQVDGAHQICDACWDSRATFRDSLLALWVQAHALLPPGAPNVDPTRRAVHTAGLATLAPLRMDVYDVIERVLLAVVSWAIVVRECNRLSPLPGLGSTRSGWLMDRALDSLALYDDSLRQQELTSDYFVSLARLHGHLVQVNRQTEINFDRVQLPCPNDACNCLTLVANAVESYVACLTCGARWGHIAFQHLVSTRSSGEDPVAHMDVEIGSVPLIEPVLPVIATSEHRDHLALSAPTPPGVVALPRQRSIDGGVE